MNIGIQTKRHRKHGFSLRTGILVLVALGLLIGFTFWFTQNRTVFVDEEFGIRLKNKAALTVEKIQTNVFLGSSFGNLVRSDQSLEVDIDLGGQSIMEVGGTYVIFYKTEPQSYESAKQILDEENVLRQKESDECRKNSTDIFCYSGWFEYSEIVLDKERGFSWTRNGPGESHSYVVVPERGISATTQMLFKEDFLIDYLQENLRFID